MFGLAFAPQGHGTGAMLQQVGLNMNYIQVCIYSPNTTATMYPHILADLELMFCADCICYFGLFQRHAPTTRPSASHIWAPSNARQPRG
jgi:hypothetical protein